MQWWLLGWTSGVYSHFQLLQDYPCFSKDEILYPRPHQPREVVTWTPSCYRALPSWPGGSLVDLGAPANNGQLITCIGHCDWVGGGRAVSSSTNRSGDLTTVTIRTIGRNRIFGNRKEPK